MYTRKCKLRNIYSHVQTVTQKYAHSNRIMQRYPTKICTTYMYQFAYRNSSRHTSDTHRIRHRSTHTWEQRSTPCTLGLHAHLHCATYARVQVAYSSVSAIVENEKSNVFYTFDTIHFCILRLACTLTASEIKTGKTPYIEQDNVPGLSGNDQILQVGDKVDPGQIVQVDECNVWYVLCIKKTRIYFFTSMLLAFLSFICSIIHMAICCLSF